jgi:hypothetical protein
MLVPFRRILHRHLCIGPANLTTLKTGEKVSCPVSCLVTPFPDRFVSYQVLNDLSLSDEVPKGSVKRDHEEFEVYCPAAYRPDGAPTENSFENHCWINPGGIWGTSSPVKKYM